MDLAYTLGERREHFTHRAFAIVDSGGTLETESFAKSHTATPAVSFIFTGQGAQWAGMGKGLQNWKVFRETIESLDRSLSHLEDRPHWSVQDELCKDSKDSRVNDPEFSQPLCTALQIGLVNLLGCWGVRPTSVAGHSSGEIAAAYAAGAISAELAIILAYQRGRATQRSRAKPGGMAAVGLNECDVLPYLQDGVEIACVNSPASVTLSGDKDCIDLVIGRILNERPDTFYRILRVDIAYHSCMFHTLPWAGSSLSDKTVDHMQEAAEAYKALISPHIHSKRDMLPMYSSVDDKVIFDPAHLNDAYWCNNLRCPVQFSQAIGKLIRGSQQDGVLLEIGPHSALSAPVRQTCQANIGETKTFGYIPSLVRNGNLSRCLLNMAGQLYIRSVPVSLSAVNGGGRILTNIPPYRWQRGDTHWSETRLAHSWRHRQHPHHELLGSRSLESSDIEPAWRNLISVESVSWICQHKLDNKIVFPCAGFIAMLGEAIQQITASEDYSVENLIVKSPMILEDTIATELLTSFHPERLSDAADSAWYNFTIASYNGHKWIKHCSGKVRPGTEQRQFPQDIKPFIRSIPSDRWYQIMKKEGIEYGSHFQGLKDITTSPVAPVAAASLCDDINLHESRYAVHPTVIDHALQLLSVAVCNGLAYRLHKRGVPASIGKVYIGKGTSDMTACCSCRVKGAMFQGDLMVSTCNRIAISLQDALFFSLDSSLDALSTIPLASAIEWKPDVDMVPTNTLLGPQSNVEEASFVLVEKLALLYTIQTAHIISPLKPSALHLQKYKSWILQRLGCIKEINDDRFWEIGEWLSLPFETRSTIVDRLHSEIHQQKEDFTPITNLAKKVFENSAALMQGEKIALNVLMEDDSLRHLYELEAKWSDWSRFLSLLGHSNPTLRVLEIGAGTGSTTAAVLDLLKSASGTRLYWSYDFTDISSGFLLPAKEKFSLAESMEFRTLDISKNPIEQGFHGGHYDLIIASNVSLPRAYWHSKDPSDMLTFLKVVHATPSLSDALMNVRALLSSNGYLILQELCPGKVPHLR